MISLLLGGNLKTKLLVGGVIAFGLVAAYNMSKKPDKPEGDEGTKGLNGASKKPSKKHKSASFQM